MLIQTISEYWLPIVASAGAIWLVSALLWAVLPWHHQDYQKLENQKDIQQSLGATQPNPGLFAIPYAPTAEAMQQEETKVMLEKGPMALITILPPDTYQMGKKLSLWLLQCLVIALVVAYLITISSAGLTKDSEQYSNLVTQIAMLVSFIAYAGAYITEGIWFSRTWIVVGKYLIDSAIYALITLVCFVYLV